MPNEIKPKGGGAKTNTPKKCILPGTVKKAERKSSRLKEIISTE